MSAAFVEPSSLLKLKEKAIFSLVYLTHKEKYSFRVFHSITFFHLCQCAREDEKQPQLCTFYLGIAKMDDI